jgi:hypothetical protein
MHFHLPKPLHGWREFAGEVGIIVIGVLIALGAEQAVSSLHDRSEARHAEENVVSEVEQDLDIFRRRAAIKPCIDRRLDEIEQLIRAAPCRCRAHCGSADRRCGSSIRNDGIPHLRAVERAC